MCPRRVLGFSATRVITSLVTKSELIERVAETTKISKGRSELAVNTIFTAMIDALVQDKGIEIRGFGSFSVRSYKAYEGRNPRTGELVHVEPKKLPFFKVGKELRERVNKPETTKPAKRKSSTTRSSSSTKSRPSTVREGKLSEDVI